MRPSPLRYAHLAKERLRRVVDAYGVVHTVVVLDSYVGCICYVEGMVYVAWETPPTCLQCVTETAKTYLDHWLW